LKDQLSGLGPTTKVLLLDQDKESRLALANDLSSAEYHIISTGLLDEAIAFYRKQAFALIILKIATSIHGGMELFQRAIEKVKECSRERADMPYTPVILLSGGTDPVNVEGAEIVGIVDHLSQPFEIAILKKKIAVFVEMHRRSRGAIVYRDSLLSMASHELKTPVTALSLQIQLLAKYLSIGKSEELMEKTFRKLSNECLVHLHRITGLIDNLLDISKNNYGRLALKLEPVNLSEMLDDILDRLKNIISKSNCNLKLNIKKHVIGMWDRLKLEQVITNLLTNAIKYGKGYPVELSIDSNGSKCQFAIKDQGIGIARDDQKRIFGYFERGEIAPQYVGNGLGLYIAREFTHALQGKIWFESEIGIGSTFYVELPL